MFVYALTIFLCSFLLFQIQPIIGKYILPWYWRYSFGLDDVFALFSGVALGVGTLATYGQKGDYFRFYVINPAVIWLSENLFTYVRNSAAQVDIIPGDARVMMEAELKQSRPQNLDILIVDAFSSDAIPVHLLTRECFSVYRKHLKAEGLLLVHITNGFLNLYPVIHTQGDIAGFNSEMIFYPPNNIQAGLLDATWVVLGMNVKFLSRSEVSSKLSKYTGAYIKTAPWSDDFTNLWQVLYF